MAELISIKPQTPDVIYQYYQNSSDWTHLTMGSDLFKDGKNYWIQWPINSFYDTAQNTPIFFKYVWFYSNQNNGEPFPWDSPIDSITQTNGDTYVLFLRAGGIRVDDLGIIKLSTTSPGTKWWPDIHISIYEYNGS